MGKTRTDLREFSHFHLKTQWSSRGTCSGNKYQLAKIKILGEPRDYELENKTNCTKPVVQTPDFSRTWKGSRKIDKGSGLYRLSKGQGKHWTLACDYKIVRVSLKCQVTFESAAKVTHTRSFPLLIFLSIGGAALPRSHFMYFDKLVQISMTQVENGKCLSGNVEAPPLPLPTFIFRAAL